ncbi:MAG: hypothetical protein O9320_08840 [Magnetospirillum sp.]|nr:hypothetical protein [Magnetospirillum sp.]
MGAFAQQIQVAIDGIEEQVRARHVAAARAALARAVEPRALPPAIIRVVDGKIGAPLESVRVPGVILFRLGLLQEVATFALAAARDLSPVKSGRYRESWVTLVDGKPRAVSEGPIGPDATVHVVNTQPYARKIQVRGARFSGVAPKIADRLANKIRAEFGTAAFRVSVAFVELPGGYVTRGRGKGAKRGGTNGKPLRYPAVLIRQKRSFD